MAPNEASQLIHHFWPAVKTEKGSRLLGKESSRLAGVMMPGSLSVV
jgi:hypothetical protein